MKFFYILALLLSIHFYGQAQVQEYRPQVSATEIIELKSTESKKIEGSIYFEDSFVRGEVVENGKKNLKAYFRYNFLKEQVEIKLNPKDVKFYFLPKSNKITYILPEYNYELIDVRAKNGNHINGFVMVFYKQHGISFISKLRPKIIKGSSSKSGFGADKPSRYSSEQNYYISLNNGVYEEVRLKEKDFEDIFREKFMKVYFSDHKIKDEGDVVKMLEYYASKAR